MKTFLKVILALVIILVFVAIKAIMNAAGINGLIPNLIYWAVFIGVFILPWRKKKDV